jgi:hypothetical protein
MAVKHGYLSQYPGTIDADYRGEIKIILINLSSEEQVIHPGDRIARWLSSGAGELEACSTTGNNGTKCGQVRPHWKTLKESIIMTRLVILLIITISLLASYHPPEDTNSDCEKDSVEVITADNFNHTWTPLIL